VFERFTDRARRSIVLAQEEARLLNHNHLGTEHLLLGLIHQGDGVAAKTLESLGISLADARTQVEVTIGRGGQAPADHIPFTPRAKKVLELSLREAQQLGHNYIGTEHILLGLVREADGVAALVLRNLGTDLARVRQQVVQLLSYAGAKGPPRPEGESAGPPFTGIIPAPCSFCGTRSPDCGTLFIGSSGALICEHCVAIAVQAREDAPYTPEVENGDDGTE
jgi:ATP-dependent Clp protease ATP-binding subunit ClpC